MTTVDVGDGVAVEYIATDPDGVPVAVAIALTIYHPDNTTTNPSMVETAPGSGVWRTTVIADAEGPWYARGVVSGGVTDVFVQEWFAADTAPPVYASLVDFKDMRRRGGDTSSDAMLQRRLFAGARLIDNKCGFPARQFWLDRTPSARIFRPRGRVTREGVLLVDDIGTDEVTVEIGSGTSWTPITDFDLYPDNALAARQAVTGLLRDRVGWPCFAGQKIRVTTRWGWPATPDNIPEANLLVSSRLYVRKDSPTGVLASAEFGGMRLSRWDPDVQDLLRDYILPGIG